jgi:membrane-bound serine protease (ClpP class)
MWELSISRRTAERRDARLPRTIRSMMLRSLGLVVVLVAVFGPAASSAAQPDDLPVVVIDVRKPMDQRLMDFVGDTLTKTDAHLFVIRVDSPGISSGEPGPMYEAVSKASAPVVVWVGARPAVAFGGAASLLNVADIGAAAPGTEIGYLEPTVVTNARVAVPFRPTHDPQGAISRGMLLEPTVVDEPIPGYVDLVMPTIGQLIVALDGTTVVRGEGETESTFEISTATTETTPEGTVLRPNRVVQFVKPSLWDRFLRLAARPEVAFFFLVVAIAAATFEFYAAGPGITAAVAVIAFVLAGYGMATLPTFWPAVAASAAGLLLYTWDFQRNQLGWRSILGSLLLVAGGLTFTDARPQFAPSWWVVLVIVAGTALFYGFALTTIVRSRFSTRTIGRDHLIGRTGVADEALSPEGVVMVDGARWRARSHREAGIESGDPIEVMGIDGIVLLVDPAERSTTSEKRGR